MSVDRGVIDAQLRAIREAEHWWEVREFRELPYILFADERIQGVIRGKLVGRLPRVRPSRSWLIVVTNQRIICLKHGLLARKHIDIPLDDITRVYHSSHLRAYRVTIVTTVHKYRIRIPKTDAFRFVHALGAVIPSESVHRLSPGLEALSWVPGITAVAALPGVEQMLSKATAPSASNSVKRSEVERLEETVEHLQNDVERLVEQVAFLEKLLEKRAEENLLMETTADS